MSPHDIGALKVQPAIKIEKLSKRYRIDHLVEQSPYRTLRESLASAVKSPWRRLRRGAASPAADFWALKDVSFQIQPGEVVGIIGRNGAGKSTLLKILSRITKPTSGRAVLRGHLGSLLEVGTGFHPELTGRENIFLSGAILGMTRNQISTKLDEIVDFSGVEDFLDTPVKRFSSGMAVRLAFSVAAHLEPDIILIDEVLAVGDASFQRKCIDRMSRLGANGKTVLVVSHNMTLVPTFCTRAILLNHGTLECDGRADEVSQKYLAMQSDSRPGGSLSPGGSVSCDRPPHFTAVRQVTEKGDPLAIHTCGEDLILDVDIASNQPIADVDIAVALETAEGLPVISGWNRELDCRVDLVSGLQTLRFRFLKLRWRPGRPLSVRLWMASEGVLDCQPQAALVEVVYGDDNRNYGTHSGQGVYAAEYEISGPVIKPIP